MSHFLWEGCYGGSLPGGSLIFGLTDPVASWVIIKRLITQKLKIW